MSEFIRSAVKTLVLSAGTAGLLTLGGGAAFAAPTADGPVGPLEGTDLTLPGEQLPTGSLPGNLLGGETVGMRAPISDSEAEPTVSGDLTVLPEGEKTLQVVLEEVEHRSTADQAGVESLLDETTGDAPGIVALRGAEDPAESLGLSTEGLLGKGLLGEGLAL